jgi:hypothetical protein
MARRMLYPLDVNEDDRRKGKDGGPDLIRNLKVGLVLRITSKRRSPWLCPAPSGGAGLFLSLYISRIYDGFSGLKEGAGQSVFPLAFREIGGVPCDFKLIPCRFPASGQWSQQSLFFGLNSRHTYQQQLLGSERR